MTNTAIPEVSFETDTFGWQDENGDFFVLGTHDLAVATRIHNEFFLNIFGPGSSEYLESALSEDEAGAVFSATWVTMPYPDENEPLDLHREPAEDRRPLLIGIF